MPYRRLAIEAFAKINLSLRVGPKRADGFHDVRTILQAIDLEDRVVVEARPGPFELVCSTPGIPTDRTNLIWKAAQHLWTTVGRDGLARDARVSLDKKIPASAGLGGGSSDAAAALAALRRAWKLDAGDDTLFAVAAAVGSDVPYFLTGGTALGIGRGEEVYPLQDLPRLSVVLIFPPFGVATADAYAWLDAARESGRPQSEGAPSYLENTWLDRIIPLANDLEAPVVERHPVVSTLKARLTKMGASMAAMSGSGSTVFGVFATTRLARSAAKHLSRSGADVAVARFLPRRER